MGVSLREPLRARVVGPFCHTFCHTSGQDYDFVRSVGEILDKFAPRCSSDAGAVETTPEHEQKEPFNCKRASCS